MSTPLRLQGVSIPDVWRVPEFAPAQDIVVPTGHAKLDAQLPGGGWPQGSLVEVLQERSGRHLWQLLLPCLAQAVAQKSGPVVLVDPPFDPFAPSLNAQGLACERLLCVRAGKPAARLWSAEQSLRCVEVAAVLAWLPEARSAELRRLHMAAQQHDKLLFVFRGLGALNDSSPARIRLLVQGVHSIEVHILKRRGPPLEAPIFLSSHPQRLAALLDSRRSAPLVALHRRSHALDRTAAIT